jgi:hypothetical protein
MTDIEQATYFLRSQAAEVAKLWEVRGAEFTADDIKEVERAIVSLGDVIRSNANRRVAA